VLFLLTVSVSGTENSLKQLAKEVRDNFKNTSSCVDDEFKLQTHFSWIVRGDCNFLSMV